MANKKETEEEPYPCDVCGKPATYNLQGGGFVLWTITKNGNFKKYDEWGMGDNENEFYCDKHAEAEKII